MCVLGLRSHFLEQLSFFGCNELLDGFILVSLIIPVVFVELLSGFLCRLCSC